MKKLLILMFILGLTISAPMAFADDAASGSTLCNEDRVEGEGNDGNTGDTVDTSGNGANVEDSE